MVILTRSAVEAASQGPARAIAEWAGTARRWRSLRALHPPLSPTPGQLGAASGAARKAVREHPTARSSVRINSGRSRRVPADSPAMPWSGLCRGVPQPSAATMPATISSTPDGSIASAAASAVQPSTRASRRMSTSSRCRRRCKLAPFVFHGLMLKLPALSSTCPRRGGR